MSSSDLSPPGRRHALRLRLEHIHRRIARVEEEIAEAQGGSELNPGLFGQEHPALRSLRDWLARLREVGAHLSQTVFVSQSKSFTPTPRPTWYLFSVRRPYALPS